MKTILSRIYYNEDILINKYKTFSDFNKNIIMHGGAFSVIHNNHIIKFDKLIEDNELHLYLSSIDKNDNCIYIIVDINSHTAYIQGITNNPYVKCFENPELNNGKTIMEITIKMLKKYKDKLELNSITLKDNSYLTCDNSTKIELNCLSFLQYNDTFYGRFNFMPIDKDLYKKYMQNKAILSITKTKQINIIKILNNYDGNCDDVLKTKMIEHYNKYLDYNIIQWFNLFSRKFMKKNCALFKYIIEMIYYKLKLYNFTGKSFTVDI
jgi:hypothetical protein